jgi:NADH dehydrogenase
MAFSFGGIRQRTVFHGVCVSTDHHVVIIGGGFGGLYAAAGLRRAPAQVTLIDRRNFHLFQPLLYQVATGGLSPGDIASPLRYVLRKNRKAKVILGDVVSVNIISRTVTLADGGTLTYDSLVVATGAHHDYFGHGDWSGLAPGLKSVEDAIEIRRRIFMAFEQAECERDPQIRQALLTFVIVGAGPTGVELAGAIGEIANETLKHDFRSINSRDSRIYLVEGNDRVLTAFTPLLSRKAERSLRRLGVTVITKTFVTGVDKEGVMLKSQSGEERRIAARTVLWAAGVKASGIGKMLVGDNASILDRAGRILVQPDLSVPGHPELFVLGDLANYTHQGKQSLPGLAPVALQQGRYVAKRIAAKLKGSEAFKPFRYFDKGTIATIGRAAAVAMIGPLRLWGYPAWLVWLFVHLMYLVGYENRLLVLTQWAWSYFTKNRGARLITFEPGWRRK